ncbi:MAG: molybdopterin-guanine dinucleotide biosynthesis protein B [Campylobacterales bacterium]|nr:molybdopterin-guanine dinucleotide biosynthesis protein B [Campylobacterales bacterium]
MNESRKRLAVAFTGPSNSGKTTLIVKLSIILQEQGFKVCIVKHDPKNKAIFDKEGKDSYKFSKTGADVAVVSPEKTTIFKQSTSSIDTIINTFDNFDYLLVEGLKTLPLPRIAVFRNSLDENYFKVTDAIATDKTIKTEQIPKNCEHLDLNNCEEIISWIDKNGKKV